MGKIRVWYVLVALVGLSASTHAEQRVHEEKGGFSYQKPDGWELQQAPGLRYRIIYKPSLGYAPNLKLMDEDFEGSLEEYLETKRSTLTTLFPGIRHEEPVSFETHTGVQGTRFLVDIEVRDRHLQQVFYLLAGRENRKFLVTCSALAADAEASIGICNDTVRTFAVKDPDAD